MVFTTVHYSRTLRLQKRSFPKQAYRDLNSGLPYLATTVRTVRFPDDVKYICTRVEILELPRPNAHTLYKVLSRLIMNLRASGYLTHCISIVIQSSVLLIPYYRHSVAGIQFRTFIPRLLTIRIIDNGYCGFYCFGMVPSPATFSTSSIFPVRLATHPIHSLTYLHIDLLGIYREIVA